MNEGLPSRVGVVRLHLPKKKDRRLVSVEDSVTFARIDIESYKDISEESLLKAASVKP